MRSEDGAAAARASFAACASAASAAPPPSTVASTAHINHNHPVRTMGASIVWSIRLTLYTRVISAEARGLR
jgi:hypothetical protein